MPGASSTYHEFWPRPAFGRSLAPMKTIRLLELCATCLWPLVSTIGCSAPAPGDAFGVLGDCPTRGECLGGAVPLARHAYNRELSPPATYCTAVSVTSAACYLSVGTWARCEDCADPALVSHECLSLDRGLIVVWGDDDQDPDACSTLIWAQRGEDGSCPLACE